MKSTSQVPRDLAHQVGEEEHRALEHADEQQVTALVVLADLAPEARTRSLSWSGWTRISPIGGALMRGGIYPSVADAHRSRRRRPRQRRRALEAQRSRPRRRRARRRRGRARRRRRARARRRAAPAARAQRAPVASSASRRSDQPRERRRQVAPAGRARSGRGRPSARSTTIVEHLRPPRAAARAVRSDVLGSAAGCTARSAGSRLAAHARAREALVLVARVLAPGQPALAAPVRRLLAREPARAAAGAPAARARRPCRAARGDPARRRAGRGSSRPGRSRVWPAARRAPCAGGQARARRRSARRAPRPGGCPLRPGARGRARPSSGDAERSARRSQCSASASSLVAAQPVVDVQRAHRARRPASSDGEIEQADRVAPAGEQHDDRAPGAQQAALAHAPGDRLDDRAMAIGSVAGHLTPRRRAARGTARSASVKPFSRTSPIRSNSMWRPALSTIARVTSTSPAAARAATRDARLTSPPK